MIARRGLRGFGGRLLWPDDPDYATAKLTENRSFDATRPALIARAADYEDVAAVVAFSRSEGLRLAVRSGGHSVAGHSTGDGVVVLDLAELNALEIDAQTRTASVGPGVAAGDYTKEAWRYGLATSFGDTGSVGLGGLVTGGGIGWLVRRDGLTIDSLVGAEVITADGRRVTVNGDENADLFWAIRGGGGNFGVVVRYDLRLHPIENVVHGTLLLRASPEVLGSMLQLGIAARDELTLMPSVMAIPAMDEIPIAEHGKPGLIIDLLWSGRPVDAPSAIAPFRALGSVLYDDVAEKPYPAVYRDRTGERNGWTASTIFLDGLDAQTVDIILRHLVDAPPGQCLAHFRILGGAAGRVPIDATAFGWRDRHLLLWVIADYGEPDPVAVESHTTWASEFRQHLSSRGSGRFVSFAAGDDAGTVESAYPPATWARLREIKRRYDPDNVFRHNHNIPP